MKHLLLKYLGTAAVALSLTSGTLHANDTVYYEQLSHMIGSNPSMIGIGNISGFSTSALSVFETPVSIDLAKHTASLYTAFLSETDQQVYSAAMTKDLSETLSYGLGILYEDIPNNDSTGLDSNDHVVSVDTFTYNSIEGIFGLSWKLNDHWRLGIAGNYYGKTIESIKGSGWDITTGLRYTSILGKMNLTARNVLANKIKYNNDAQETLVRSYEASYETPEFPILLTRVYLQTAYDSNVEKWKNAAGIRLHPLHNDVISLSAGWKEIRTASTDNDPVTTFGVGLNLSGLSVNYAYDQSEMISNQSQHYISLDIKL